MSYSTLKGFPSDLIKTHEDVYNLITMLEYDLARFPTQNLFCSVSMLKKHLLKLFWIPVKKYCDFNLDDE
jgi:hypothetical protein